ncbi:MAG: site-specific integrase [Candidatus Bathyarchaeota archaeon]|nr:site-specific integrase [Candidatus Bathyarchaeota archaeon]
MPKTHKVQEWEKDPYAVEWLSKVGKRTQKNYRERYPKWLNFIGMTPTEQFKKRIKDLQSDNPKERGFFEDKVIEFKNMLITQNLKPSSISCTLTPILSFFSAHRVPLRFKRGELKVEARAEDKVVKEWIPDNQQVKQIYQHGDARDRALLLCLYHSGFSETDVSSLNVEDLPNIQQCEGHYPITMYREKTNVLQRTCLSEECVHDIKAMLEEREAKDQLKPDKTGKTPMFISQKGERLTTRFINDIIKTMVEKTYGKDRAKEFKTKSLRDAYNDALLRANLTQEIKDTLFGHKREGAREKYAISQATIIDAYNKAFQYLTVNHGTQARKDIEVMRSEMIKMSQLIVKMSEETVKLREENKTLKEQLAQFAHDTEARFTVIEERISGKLESWKVRKDYTIEK